MDPPIPLSYFQQALILLGLFALGIQLLRPILTSRRNNSNGLPQLEMQENPGPIEKDQEDDDGEGSKTDVSSTVQGPRPKLKSNQYRIGIITALYNELRATLFVLDQRHDKPSDFEKLPHDHNQYSWGSISNHNIVIVCFPHGKPGIASAATVANSMAIAFPSIRMGLMVGIGGGIPSLKRDIRLGDIVVSAPGDGTAAGVVQYDFGKEEGKFRRKGSLNSPPQALLGAVAAFKAEPRVDDLRKTIQRASTAIERKYSGLDDKPSYRYQGTGNDRLFQAWYDGVGPLCWLSTILPYRTLDGYVSISRNKRTPPETPRIHYGTIASGNRVIKRARTRDRIAADLNKDTNGANILCFEMEAAGLMDNFPCLVVRGVSDYSDSHKNDRWHNYAAMTAAAFVRELLHVLDGSEVDTSPKASEVMELIQEVHNDVKELRKDLSDTAQAASTEQIGKWLNPSDPSTKFNEAKREARLYDTTNNWFFEHFAYKEYRHMWVHGASGCGKTFLSSNIIERLSRDGWCLYFFFDIHDEAKQTLNSLLRSLIWQLFSREGSHQALVQKLHQRERAFSPSTDGLVETFDEMVQQMGKVQVVLDALDESKGDKRAELTQWLHIRTKHQEPDCCKLRIIMTSKSNQPDLDYEIGSLQPSGIKLDMESVSPQIRNEIGHYVHMRLATDQRFSSWRNDLESDFEQRSHPRRSSYLKNSVDSFEEWDQDYEFDEDFHMGYRHKSDLAPGSQDAESNWKPILHEMEKALVEKAGTMFRWASLQLHVLGEQGTVRAIKEKLADLPETLNEIYHRSLEGIPEGHREDAARILQLLLVSNKPLTIEQVLESTSVVLNADPGDSIDANSRLQNLKPLSSLMSSLIKKTKRREYSDWRWGLAKTDDRAENMVWFFDIAHSSVRDYLFSSNSQKLPQFGFSVKMSKAAIVEVCLAYMSSMTRNNLSFGVRHSESFAEFSKRTWIALVKDQAVEEESYTAILKFLLCKSSSREAIASESYGSEYRGPPLYVASAIGLLKTAEKLLSEGVNASENSGEKGFANAVAPSDSYYKMKLHEYRITYHGSDSDSDNGSDNDGDTSDKNSGSDSGSGSDRAGCQSDEEHVNDEEEEEYSSSSEEYQSDADCRTDYDFDSALQAACYNGYEDIVKALLERVADVNAPGGSIYGTPLHAACLGKQTKIVRCLLNKDGIDVNREGGKFGHALQAACYHGHKEIAELLIQKGADANAQGGQCGTALYCSCSLGDHRLSMFLLKNGADVNTETGDYGTALQVACKDGHEDIVKLLINNGADIDVSHGRHGTPLEISSDQGYMAIVQVLLENGVNIDAGCGRFGNALQAAASRGHDEIVQALLLKGANCKVNEGRYGTALQAAASGGNHSIVTKLLNAGADVNAVGGVYKTALRAAVSAADEEIVRSLLEKNADFGSKENDIGGLLVSVVENGSRFNTSLDWSGIVLAFLKAGAKADSLNDGNRSLLDVAAYREKTPVVQVLLKYGASSTGFMLGQTKGVFTGEFILDVAKRRCDESIFRRLSSIGSKRQVIADEVRRLQAERREKGLKVESG